MLSCAQRRCAPPVAQCPHKLAVGSRRSQSDSGDPGETTTASLLRKRSRQLPDRHTHETVGFGRPVLWTSKEPMSCHLVPVHQPQAFKSCRNTQAGISRPQHSHRSPSEHTFASKLFPAAACSALQLAAPQQSSAYCCHGLPQPARRCTPSCSKLGGLVLGPEDRALLICSHFAAARGLYQSPHVT